MFFSGFYMINDRTSFYDRDGWRRENKAGIAHTKLSTEYASLNSR